MTLLMPLKLMGLSWLRLMGSLVAIAPFLINNVAIAQNQSDVTGPNLSDVTGPNLSDVTGPNLSDVTGPNLSDNTGVLGGSVINSAVVDRLSNLLREFFDEFGDELDIDRNASLVEQLRQAKLACEEQPLIRRFSREPGENIQTTPACAELSRLLQLARSILAQPNQVAQPNQAVDRPSEVEQRLW